MKCHKGRFRKEYVILYIPETYYKPVTSVQEEF